MKSSEPSWDESIATDPCKRDVALLNMLSWYRNNTNFAQHRKWVQEYAKKNKIRNIDTSRESMSRVNDQMIYYCRLSNLSFPLNDYEKSIIDSNIVLLKSKKEVKQEDTNTVSIQDRVADKSADKCGELLHLVDEFLLDIKNRKKSEDKNYLNMTSWIASNEIKPMIASKMIPIIDAEKKEFENALKDSENRKYYSHLTDSQIKRVVSIYSMILESLGQKKTEKKTRTRRTTKKRKNPVQLTSKVKYLSETDQYGGVKSELPSKLIGAKKIILFNVKYRTFSIFESVNEDGMTIKGTTIYNFDTAKSVCKKIRENYVKDLLKVAKTKGIRAIKTKYGEINSKESVPNGRINGDCLIVRAL